MPDKTSKLEQSLIEQALAAAREYGSAVGEGTMDMARGIGDMFKVYRGDPVTANMMGQGMLEGGKNYVNATPGTRAAMLTELVTGVPVRQVGSEIGEGNYAKAAGHATPGLAALLLGARMGVKGKAPKSGPTILEGPSVALDSRVSGLPPVEAPMPEIPANLMGEQPKFKPSRKIETEGMGTEHVRDAWDSTFSSEPSLSGGTGYSKSGNGTAVIPPATAREMSRLMSELVTPADGPAGLGFKEVAKRAPRTTGHVTRVEFNSPVAKELDLTAGQMSTAGDMRQLEHPWMKQDQNYFWSPDDDYTSVLTFSPEAKPSSVAHEMTHTAQQLRHGPNFEDLYDAAELRNGYWMNPYEVRARQAELGGAKVRNPQKKAVGMRIQELMNNSLEPVPAPKAEIPAFRSKSGMATDVLNELKDSPLEEYLIDNKLDDFADKYAGPSTSGKIPTAIGSAVSDFPLKNTVEPDLAKRIADPNPVNELKRATLRGNPTDYMALIRSMDEGAIDMPREVELPDGSVFKNPQHPLGADTDKVIDALSQYFTEPQYDPFPKAKAEPYLSEPASGKTIAELFNEYGVDSSDSRSPMDYYLDAVESADKGPLDSLKSMVDELDPNLKAKQDVDVMENNPRIYGEVVDDVNKAHKGQKFSGGLYDHLDDLKGGELSGMDMHLSQLGMDWQDFLDLSPEMQKYIVDTFRAARKRKK